MKRKIAAFFVLILILSFVPVYAEDLTAETVESEVAEEPAEPVDSVTIDTPEEIQITEEPADSVGPEVVEPESMQMSIDDINIDEFIINPLDVPTNMRYLLNIQLNEYKDDYDYVLAVYNQSSGYGSIWFWNDGLSPFVILEQYTNYLLLKVFNDNTSGNRLTYYDGKFISYKPDGTVYQSADYFNEADGLTPKMYTLGYGGHSLYFIKGTYYTDSLRDNIFYSSAGELGNISVDANIDLPDGMVAFYQSADINEVIQEVSSNVFKIFAVLLAVYPFMYLLKCLIRYAERAFDIGVIREMENGGLWRRLPDGSLHNALDRIAAIPAFKKVLRR